MHKIISLTFLVVFLASCSPAAISPTATAVDTITPTATSTPTSTHTPKPTATATLSVSATPSATPDPASQIAYSPDGKFIAKRYDPYGRPSLEKPVIEIFDEQNKLLWQIPYQGEMPTGDPRPSLSIYKWANDSSGLFFYYAFSYDGYHTLWDGFNLQKVNVKTGAIEKVFPGKELSAFAFSPDESSIAYAQYQDIPPKLVIRNLSTKGEKHINIDLTSENLIQVGWISWSPSGDKVIYHVENNEQVWAYYLDVETMEQKELLQFWLEEYWFDGWTADEKPRYLDIDQNVVIIDVETNEITVIGTATPKP